MVRWSTALDYTKPVCLAAKNKMRSILELFWNLLAKWEKGTQILLCKNGGLNKQIFAQILLRKAAKFGPKYAFLVIWSQILALSGSFGAIYVRPKKISDKWVAELWLPLKITSVT